MDTIIEKKNTIKLNNGVQIPIMGFGTHRIPNGEMVINAVKEAIKAGYRHIDTAWDYRNETGVGIAIKECIEEGIVKREDLFIVSKVHPSKMTYEGTLENFHESLSDLGLDYLDLYLIHDVPRANADWKKSNIDTWRAFEKLYQDKKVRAIGVCNYGIKHLEYLLSKADVKPMVNQIELHPQHQQREIVDFCKKNNIHIESWGPLLEGKICKNPIVQEIANKNNQTPENIAIKWNLQKNNIVLVGSKTPKHIHNNFEAAQIPELSKDDMYALDALNGGEFSGRAHDGIKPIIMVPLNYSGAAEYIPIKYERIFSLFGIIPFLKEQKHRWNKTKWYLFGIPILKIIKKDWTPKGE